MVRRVIHGAAAAIALLCIAAPTAPAATDLATNAAGDQALLHTVLLQPNRPMYAAQRAMGATFGSPAPIVPAARFARFGVPSTVIDDSGGAVTASISTAGGKQRESVVVSAKPPGGSFGPPQILASAALGVDVQIGGNGSGDVVVVWATYDHGTKYSVRPRGGEFTKPSTVPGGRSMRPIGIAVDADGTATLVSARDDTHLNPRVVASTRPPGGSFGAPRLIPRIPTGRSLAFGSARSGRALIAWHAIQHDAIRAVERQPGGDFGARFDVVHVTDTNGVKDVAIAPNGAAAVLLSDSADVRVATRPPGGSFGALTRLGTQIGFARAAVGERGDVALAWGEEGNAVGAAYLGPGATDWQLFEMAAARPGSPGGPLDPAVVVDGSGRATTAWEESDGETVQTFTRDFDGTGAPPPAVEVDSLPTFRQEHPASACHPRGARVVRRSPQAVIFVRPPTRYGCLRARGVPVPLFDNIFPPRTMAFAGPLVAYGSDFADEYDAITYLTVTDLRDEMSGVNRIADLETTRVGELAATKLRLDGAVAWASCPAKQSVLGRLSRACERPGGKLKHVWALDSAAREPRLLDSGRRIDPRTLELRGSRLTWRKRGRVQHATLR